MIKESFTVRPIKSAQCRDWILFKHYAKRLPPISFAFGLYRDSVLVGILTIGKPASPAPCIGVCGKEYSPFVYELSRLVVNEGLEKNALSFFVSQCLKLLPDSLILISYADSGQHHHGYIYQATNWIYTGATKERTDPATENGKHSRHRECLPEYGRQIRTAKHRYVYFVGKRRKEFLAQLRWKVEPYPKGDNRRYDASFQPEQEAQATLF